MVELYLAGGKGNSRLKMREGAMPEIGAQGLGPVMAGTRSVEEALRAPGAVWNRMERPGYVRVSDYDPVLRFHCRMG